jgi:hypothetical protein
MIGTRVILDETAVNQYLAEEGLEEGFAQLETVMYQGGGTARGMPCALLVATVDGRKVLVKTTLKSLIVATDGLNAKASMMLGDDWRGP